MAEQRRDLISRGTRGSNPTSSTTFVGLRALDSLVQYGVLSYGATLLNKIHIDALPSAELAATGVTRDLSLGILGLGVPLKSIVLMGLALGGSIRQIFWHLRTANEPLTMSNALVVVAFNVTVNAINSLVSLTLLSSKLYSGSEHFFDPVTVTGIALFVVGIATETISEVQRKHFKDAPENKGKCFTGGLFSYARHINYAGYTLWRSAYALVAGGPIWALITAAFFGSDFATRGIPVLDDYCTGRYGAQWAAYKKKTPYVLVPGIY